MCFALLALGQHKDYPFILAANRDEFTERPALALHDWEDVPGVLAGRDLTSMGSWLALNRNDRHFALVTNVRDGSRQTAERSRGLLIRDLVDARYDFAARLRTVVDEQTRYAGFNVLAGDIGGDVHYFSNRTAQPPTALRKGLYGLSNAALDTPWPKVVRGKAQLAALLAQAMWQADDLFSILADDTIAADEDLPATGVPLAWERRLSPVFITGEDYRTRCATVILMDHARRIFCWERSFSGAGEYTEKHFEC